MTRLAALVCVVVAMATPVLAQSSEREAILRLASDRGVSADEAAALLRPVDEAGAKGLPVAPLTNKVREGLAKGVDPKRIDTVVRQLAGHLGTADALIRELNLAAGPVRDEPVTLLADALAGGVSTDEVRELRRQAQPAATLLPSDSLAGAAKGLSLIKSASLPAAEGTAVMAEAVRHGYRAHEMLEVGRQVKRRERDYRDGHASLRALREAIARGERPEQIFTATRAAAERPSATRPDAATERPARPATPERPVRPERPERPQATERPGR